MKFCLGGDQGLDVFAEGYPKSHKIDCDTEDPIDEIESTLTAGPPGGRVHDEDRELRFRATNVPVAAGNHGHSRSLMRYVSDR